jgi:hypothetical protein
MVVGTSLAGMFSRTVGLPISDRTTVCGAVSGFVGAGSDLGMTPESVLCVSGAGTTSTLFELSGSVSGRFA